MILQQLSLQNQDLRVENVMTERVIPEWSDVLAN